MATSSLRPVDPQAARADVGRLVLRLALGILLLLHGIAKLSGPPDFIVDILAKAGLPGFLAYGVYIGEILAPLLLIVGVWTRAAAAVIVVNMIAAVYLVHLPELFMLGKEGGYALELQAMYLFSALALCFLGGGRYSVGGRYGPMN
ncbi:MAG: DoxX family protein [Caldimonas sp.]